MSTTALTPVSITETRMSVAQMVAQRDAIVEAMKKVMRVDFDFGIVPGTPKPTLYKPGSEKILALFHLAASPAAQDLSTPDCIRYQVIVTITHAPTGGFLGQGIGEASSAESKYQWRAAVCDQEWNETPEDRRRNKWKKGDRGVYQVKQVRAEMEDVANTVLKMAKKRAQIDAVLTVTAASDIFSQDLKDLKEAGFDVADETRTPGNPRPERRRLTNCHGSCCRRSAATKTATAPQSGDRISESQGKRFWAIALNRLGEGEFRQIGQYLRDVHGIQYKGEMLASRYDEAIKWAETGRG